MDEVCERQEDARGGGEDGPGGLTSQPPRPGGGGRKQWARSHFSIAHLSGGADLEQVQPVRVPVVDNVGQLAPLLFPAAAATAARHPPQQPSGALVATHTPGGPRRAVRLLRGVPGGL